MAWELLKHLRVCVVDSNDMGYLRAIKAHYGVFLINNSEMPIEKVETYIGGFSGQIETSRVYHDEGPLSAKSAMLIEPLDMGMLDFMNWYYIDVQTTRYGILKLECSFNGWSLKEDNLIPWPVINTKGYSITLKMRSNILISQMIKASSIA